MHPAVEFKMQFFANENLHPALRPLVQQFAELAKEIAEGPQNTEVPAAIDDLIAAKDHAVRALVADGALARWDISAAAETPGPSPDTDWKSEFPGPRVDEADFDLHLDDGKMNKEQAFRAEREGNHPEPERCHHRLGNLQGHRCVKAGGHDGAHSFDPPAR